LAYHEDPSYVPLVRRAYELWQELQRRFGEPLLTVTGCLNIGVPNSIVFDGCLKSARLHKLPHEVLEPDQVMARHPALQLTKDMKAVWQPDGGFLEPEKCIVAYVREALRLGAEVHGRERVHAWHPHNHGVEVTTDRGTYRASKLVISAGAWAARLLADLGLPLAVERQVVGWFQPQQPELFEASRLPVWMLSDNPHDYAPGYGFPIHELPGFKLGIMHHRQQVVDPDHVNREPDQQDEALLRRFIRQYFPLADGPTLALKVCLFTNTPDEHFVLDVHPRHSQVIMVSCCSGHGFKFASVIGEIVADLCEHGTTQHDIKLFSAGRFAAKRSRGVRSPMERGAAHS
jgi:sarcosine oxidase